MHVETRFQKFEQRDQHGQVQRVTFGGAFARIGTVTAAPAESLKAVCLNGRWFVPAEDPVSQQIETEWSALA